MILALMPLFFAAPASANETTEPVVVVVTTPGGDDQSYQVPLTTTVTFDGVQYNSVYATTNSVITFGRPDGTYWDFPQTPSISLYSMDWVVYPQNRPDEHLIIRASDGGFQVDISARPIWLQNTLEPTNINIVAAINTDGTVSISYSLSGPTYEGQTRTGVRLTNGSIVTLEQYGVVQVEEPPVLEPEPVAPTPTPTPTPEPTPTPTPEPTTEPVIRAPFVPEGATILSEGSSIEVVAPAGQRIISVMAWYGDPDNDTRGIDVSSTLTQLASGQTSVTIDSDNRYGDPAGGTVKVLIFIATYEAIPQPTPSPSPIPETPVIIEPAPRPSEEPVVPEPEPTIPPTEEPTPAPETPEEPTEEPAPEIVDETPAPEPEETPEPEPEPELPVDLDTLDPESLSDEEIAGLVSAAHTILESAEQGSAAYEQALEALAVAAIADDPQLPTELAGVPGAEQVLEAFNALGNIGADMAPEVREEAEQTVVASVIAVGAAISAMSTTTTAAAASTGASASSSSTRRGK
jgi:hypothetical protein